MARPFALLADAGWIGVDLFFVLSGFLITSILLRAKQRPHYFRNFYARRALRIFPIYYLTLIVVVVLMPRFMAPGSGVTSILQNQWWLWTYTMNYSHLNFSAGWMRLGHLWSLAVEEQYYLVWPVVLYLTSARQAALICCATIIGAPLLRLALALNGHPFAIYLVTPCRADELAIGSLMAILLADRVSANKLARFARLATAPLAIVATSLVFSGLMTLVWSPTLTSSTIAVKTLTFSLNGFLFGSVITRMVADDSMRFPRRLMETVPLRRLGRYSYAMYLVHYPLVPLFDRLFPERALSSIMHSRMAGSLAYCLLAFAAVTACAALSWHGLERHLLSLKEKFSS